MLQYHTCMQYTVRHNTYTEMNLSTVKWAQWDETQYRELLVLFICVCSSLCTSVAHNIAQNRSDNFPSCPPDNHHCSNDVYLRERGELAHLEIDRSLSCLIVFVREHFKTLCARKPSDVALLTNGIVSVVVAWSSAASWCILTTCISWHSTSPSVSSSFRRPYASL